MAKICPQCQNEILKNSKLIKGGIFKPSIFKDTLTCPVCGWKKVLKVTAKDFNRNHDIIEEWKD